MASALPDRILVVSDGLLLAAVLAVGVLGDRLPLPRGQDVLAAASRDGAPAPALPVPPPVPAPVTDASAVPAPAPPPETPPEPAAKPGQVEWTRFWDAREQGMTALNAARNTSEPDRKRQAYGEAEKAFKEALSALERFHAACPDRGDLVDENGRNLRMLIGECHKSSPMNIR